MEILVTAWVPTGPLRDAIDASSELGRTFSRGIVRVATLDADGSPFRNLMEISETGFEWVMDVRFSDEEITRFEFLEVRPQKLLSLKDAEANLNDYWINVSEAREFWPGSPIYCPRGLVIGRSLPKPDCIESLPFAAEYVTGEQATGLLRAIAGDLGLELVPVFSLKEGWTVDALAHLYTAQVAPQVQLNDCIWHDMCDGRIRWRRLGCLAYHSLATMPPVCRTAEHWASWLSPQWIVSQKVRQHLADGNIRGWRYLPVMETGSPEYREHLEQIREVRAMLEANPNSRMR